MRKRLGLRRYVGLTAIVAAAALVVAGVALGVTGAINTTDDPFWAGPADTGTLLGGQTQPCLNGQPGHTDPAVNCNIYAAKTDVFLSGSPITAAVGDGTYFFAVLSPGGQPAPNDGGTNNANGELANLSDNADAWTNREFSVSSGTITMLNSSTHAYDATRNLVQVAPYADTPNPGGVYILAVCAVPDPVTGSPGVNPRDCKYDAFKVNAGAACDPNVDPTCGTPPAFDLTAFKSATPSFTATYAWDVSKSVAAPTRVEQIGGSATFNYTVTATWSGPTNSGWQVNGTIDVLNPNAATVAASISDQITTSGTTDDGHETCTVYDPVNTATALSNPYTLAANSDTGFPYTCTFDSHGPADTSETNVATISWAAQTLVNGAQLAAGSTPATHAIDWSTPTTVVNATTTVSDNFNSGGAQALGLAGVDGSWTTDSNNHLTGFAESYASGTKTFTLTYSRSISVPAHGCTDYPNTATERTGTDPTTPDTVTVTVCGPANNSALTIGFWKGPNGNSLIQTYCAPSGKTSLATYLATLAPFSSASGKSCAQLVTYVNGIIQGANATNMNTMLKAQMLATALDVYFSDPTKGYTTSATGKIKPPSSFLTQGPLGGFVMDLRVICPMVDNTTTGSASCKNGAPSTNAFASGAVPWTTQSIQGILTFAGTAGSSPWATGAYVATDNWYAGNRTLEEVLKNIFDQINNNLAFAP